MVQYKEAVCVCRQPLASFRTHSSIGQTRPTTSSAISQPHGIPSSVLRTVAFTERGGFPIESRPHFSFHAVMPATGFKSKRHRSHRKRNTWANTADSVLRIVQHGLAKTTPRPCRAFSWQHAFARSEFGGSAPAARMSHSLPKKWLPQCLGEPPNRPS